MPSVVIAWSGVVMIERPDQRAHVPFSDGPPCLVRSVRTAALDGHRAIVHKMPYRQLQHYFDSASQHNTAYAWADFFEPSQGEEAGGGHLQLGCRATQAEWAQSNLRRGVLPDAQDVSTRRL